jgi:hypothetical protein
MKGIAFLTCLALLLPGQQAHGERAESSCEYPDAKEIIHLGQVQSDPARLLRLRESRREHYEKILGVIDSLLSALPGFDPRATEARYGVRNICTQQLMSQPPKILMALTIDEVRYQMVLLSIVPPRPVS